MPVGEGGEVGLGRESWGEEGVAVEGGWIGEGGVVFGVGVGGLVGWGGGR